MADPVPLFLKSLMREAIVDFTLSGELRVAPDWAAPPRSLPMHLLYFVTEHAFAGQIAGQPIRVEAGSLLWVMPGVPHAFWIDRGEPEFSVRYFRVGLSHEQAPLRLSDDFLLVNEAWEAGQVVQHIVDEVPSNLPFADQRLRAMLTILFSSAVRLRDGREDGSRTFSRTQRIKLTHFVRDSARLRPTPADLAAELDLSPDYFARLFRKSFGISPRAWLVDQRIRHAASAMLNSTRSISQTAIDFGYEDVFLFSRQFKQVMGMGPLRYRKQSG